MAGLPKGRQQNHKIHQLFASRSEENTSRLALNDGVKHARVYSCSTALYTKSIKGKSNRFTSCLFARLNHGQHSKITQVAVYEPYKNSNRLSVLYLTLSQNQAL